MRLCQWFGLILFYWLRAVDIDVRVTKNTLYIIIQQSQYFDEITHG